MSKNKAGIERTWGVTPGPHGICEHGSIRRKCAHCEVLAQDARIAELEAVLREIADYGADSSDWFRHYQAVKKTARAALEGG